LKQIDLAGQPLDLELTLNCGQTFRWRRLPNGVWQGVIGDRLVELLVEGGCLNWATYPNGGEELVRDYLLLDTDVLRIYSVLSDRDPDLRDLTHRFRGMRLLRQDPTETLLSFVCSAANSIPRIAAAIEQLCVRIGQIVCTKNGVCYYAFPTVEAVACAGSDMLRNTCLLAFRGDNLKSVAGQLLERSPGWLLSLRKLEYCAAKAELLKVRGVGRKIADCVCLFALDKHEAVPVDTHVHQLAKRLFLTDLTTKTVTESVYARVQKEFLDRYGELAGWAQQFLFYEDVLRTRAGRPVS
jgi:N-glycosylase/DNA lyase